MANILIVDDDLDIAETFSEILKEKGHHVQTARSGQEGLHFLRAQPLPNLLVLDVEMPILDGPGVAHQMFLRDGGQEFVPILLVSARRDLTQIAGRMGTPYFLSKPCAVAEFLDVVDGALRGHLAPSSA
jgi:DNA-binding response OmpR family regulator